MKALEIINNRITEFTDGDWSIDTARSTGVVGFVHSIRVHHTSGHGYTLLVKGTRVYNSEDTTECFDAPATAAQDPLKFADSMLLNMGLF